MYLHHLSDSREARERLERFFRWARGRRAPLVGTEEIATTVLKGGGGHYAIRMEIPGVEVDGVAVEDDAVIIKLSPRAKGAGGDAGRA